MPWTHPEVLQAAFDIGMTGDERTRFRGYVTEFLQGFDQDVFRLRRGNNQADLGRKVLQKRRSRVKTMDKQMRTLLSEEKYAGYELYRDLLLQKMDDRGRRRRR